MNSVLVTYSVKCFFVLLVTLQSVLSVASSVDGLAKTCVACHGENGISGNTVWPNLAGQKQGYLRDQLLAFRDGNRVDPLMNATVKGLSNQDIESLALHFSSLVPKVSSVEGKSNQAGENIRARCISCHGMQGKTVNDQWPNISGQKKGYLQKQLKAFRDGSRHSEVMAVIVKGFTDQQIEDVSEYYSQQHH